jgi:hypothetical protein
LAPRCFSHGRGVKPELAKPAGEIWRGFHVPRVGRRGYNPGMAEEQNPVWPWILSTLIGLPVLYIASFGPACWIASRNLVLMDTISCTYSPVLTIAADDERIAGKGLRYWARFCGGEEGITRMIYPPIICYDP